MHTSTCLLLRYVNGGSTSPNHFSVYIHTVSKGLYAFTQSVRGKELLASPLMQHVGSLFQEKQICRSSFQSAVVQREPPLDSGPHRTRDAPRPSATAHPFYPRKHVSEGSGTKKSFFVPEKRGCRIHCFFITLFLVQQEAFLDKHTQFSRPHRDTLLACLLLDKKQCDIETVNSAPPMWSHLSDQPVKPMYFQSSFDTPGLRVYSVRANI